MVGRMPRVAFRALCLALALSALLVPAAQAAKPVRIGTGVDANVALDSIGTAYIAWRGNEPLNTTLHFCRLPRAAAACDVTTAIPVPGDSLTRPFVMVDGSTVRVLQYRYGLTDGLTPDRFAAIDLFTSADGGRTFDAGRYVGTVPFVDAARGPGGGVSLATNAVTEGELYQRVPVDGSPGTTGRANLSTDHPYNGAVAMLDANSPLVVFVNGSGDAQFRRFTGAGDPNDVANWTAPKDIGYADYPRLASGSSGMFMLARNRDSNLELRKFSADTFAAASVLPDSRGEAPQDHLVHDGGGLLHVLLPQITAGGSRLYYATSTGGTRWAATKFAFEPLAQGVRAAFGSDHIGVAVWSGSGSGAVSALAIAPQQKPRLPSKPPAQARRAGARVNVTLKGRIPVPTGLRAADVCTGRLRAQVKRASKTVRLGSACTFKGRLSLNAATLGSASRLTLKLSFLGNELLKPTRKSYRLKIR